MFRIDTFSGPGGTWSRFTLFSVCLLAFSVSLGTAMVSLSKVVLLLALIGQLWHDGRQQAWQWLKQAPHAVWWVLIALVWLAMTGFWTEAESRDALRVFYGHARLIWLLAVLYLLPQPARAWTALKWLALGQLFVVLLSWLMWCGVPLAWLGVKLPYELDVAFTSTLEQPVMSTLLAVLLWHLRAHWTQGAASWHAWVWRVALALTMANVFFIMTGRTGYLVMLVFVGVTLLMLAPPRWRIAAVLLPVLVVLALWQLSPRFHARVMQVQQDIVAYRDGNINTSQGLRLDNWRVAVEGGLEKPWFGHGVGSFSKVYEAHHGFERRVVLDPHQQYLFWWVEGGAVAVALLLGFLAALLRDARALPRPAGRALVCTVAVVSVMALSTCPFFGAGMGEFFLVMMAALLATRDATQG